MDQARHQRITGAYERLHTLLGNEHLRTKAVADKKADEILDCWKHVHEVWDRLAQGIEPQVLEPLMRVTRERLRKLQPSINPGHLDASINEVVKETDEFLSAKRWGMGA